MRYKKIYIYIMFLISFSYCYADSYNLEKDLDFLGISMTNINNKEINKELFYKDNILCYGSEEDIKNQEIIYVDGEITYKYLPEDYNGKIAINPKYLYYNQEPLKVEKLVLQTNLQNYLSWLNNKEYGLNHNNRIKNSNLLYNDEYVITYNSPLTPIRCGLKNIKLVRNPTVKRCGYTSVYSNKDAKTVYFKLPKVDENFNINCKINLEQKDGNKILKVESSLETLLTNEEIDKYEITIYKNKEIIYSETRNNIKNINVEKTIDNVSSTDIFTSTVRVSTAYKSDGVFSKQVKIQPPSDNLVKEIKNIKIGRLSSYKNKFYFENRSILEKNIFQAGEYMIIKLETNGDIEFVNNVYKHINNNYYIVNKLPLNKKSTLQSIADLRLQSNSYFEINYEKYLSRIADEYLYKVEYIDAHKEVKKIEIKYDILGNIFSNLNYTFKFADMEKYEI